MTTNVLRAISNIVEGSAFSVPRFSTSKNRANSVGESLERYIKDAFCNSFSMKNELQRTRVFSRYFSYLGNQNNPPDVMIRGGDALEIKKVENSFSGIALNSSYPKEKIFSGSPMITVDCRECEDWREKDILYAIGSVSEGDLKSLWFVHGSCYAAGKEVYERIRATISQGLRSLEGIEFSETKELARVNRVDPLGITYLRVRGMWHIENPTRVFGYLLNGDFNPACQFLLHAIFLKEKYYSFPQDDRENLESIQDKVKNFSIRDVQIKSPNNPATLLEAKLLSFCVEKR